MSPSEGFVQKKKWARTHRTRPRAFEQAMNYTERATIKQPPKRRHKEAQKAQNQRRSFVLLCGYEFNFALTTSLTVRPSAFLPASAACAAFITLPMSFIEFAPVSVIAAITACSISSVDA